MATLMNKRALVLGGSRGIGAAIVERFSVRRSRNHVYLQSFGGRRYGFSQSNQC